MKPFHRGELTGESLLKANRFTGSNCVFLLVCQCGATVTAERDDDGYFYPSIHVVAGTRTATMKPSTV